MIVIPEHVKRFINRSWIENKTEQECIQAMLENPEFSSYSYGTIANYVGLYYMKY